jgi:hypothetical protein
MDCFDRRTGIVGHFLGVDDVAVEGQVGDEIERGLLGVDVNVVVNLVSHLGHLFAGGDSLAAHQQLGAVDVDDFVDPRRVAAEEALRDGADQRLVGRGKRVLAGLVNAQDSAA